MPKLRRLLPEYKVTLVHPLVSLTHHRWLDRASGEISERPKRRGRARTLHSLGFELYNGTKWDKATGRIDGKKVILSAEGVTSATRLRYGCGETLMELGDGTIIEVLDGKYTSDKTAQTITVTYNGKQYVIHSDTTDMVRTLDYGNITNASGVPMPIFAMDIVAE